MYAVEILVTEHETIQRLCSVMRCACLLILDKKAIKTEDFRKFLHIIREYADRHHHGKEELLLFKDMEEHLGSVAKQLVRNGMMVEHDLGRLYARQMEEAIDHFEKSSENDSLLDIITNTMAYVDLLRRHIERENGVVYPFAEKNLSPEILDSLNQRTKEFEEQEGKETFLAEIRMELKELENRYVC